MTTRDVFLGEFQQIRVRLGGARGVLTLAALAALATMVPMRAGNSFLDPAYLVAYSFFAMIFASSWAAESFAGERERAFLENRSPLSVPDWAVAMGKVLAGTVWGWLCWALILGASLASLNASSRALMLPPGVTMAGLAAFSLAVSFAVSAVGASVALSVNSVAMARQLMRLGALFLAVAVFFVPQFVGADVVSVAKKLLAWHRVGQNLLLASPVFVLIGLGTLRHVAAQLAEKREKLSILGN